MASISQGLRRQAMQKIAALAVTTSTAKSNPAGSSDLDRLLQACSQNETTHKSTGNNPRRASDPRIQRHTLMNIRQFEALLAICKAIPLLKDHDQAEKLVTHLSPYIVEAHIQEFVPSPFFRDIEPSPIESLSFHLTSALLLLGTIEHSQLRKTITNQIWIYLDRCLLRSSILASPQVDNSNDVQEAIAVATLTLSLIGFLEAATTYIDLWSPEDRLNLLKRFRKIFSENFLVTVDLSFSTIRNLRLQDLHVKEWKRYLRQYSANGRPLGTILLQRSFIWLVVATTSLLSVDIDVLRGADILELRMSDRTAVMNTYGAGNTKEADIEAIQIMADIAFDEMKILEEADDYLRLGSTWQQQLAFSVKASALVSYLNCILLNEYVADVEILMSWLENTLIDPLQMADEMLACVVLRSLALISKSHPELAPNVSRILPRFIVQGRTSGQTIAVASSCLAYVLRLLSPDAVITTIYILGNVLSSGTTNEKTLSANLNEELGLDVDACLHHDREKSALGSSISLAFGSEEDTSIIYGNVVEAICSIATACYDPKIIALAQSMLSQRFDKINTSVDARIITETSRLALCGGPLEFRSLLKLYAKITTVGILNKNEALLLAVAKGRNHLSLSLQRDSPLFEIYLQHLLEAIISKGDIHQAESSRETDFEFAAQEIAQLLQPLALLMSNNNLAVQDNLDEEIWSLVRDSWFNLVVHGYGINTNRGKKYIKELRLMAVHSKPLVTEQRGEQVESDIELNTILRRGNNSENEVKQKKRLSALLPSRASEIRGLNYRKVIFLQAAYLIETLRADTGDCTKALIYFLEPSMRRGDMSITMEAVTSEIMGIYLSKTLEGTNSAFSAPYVSKQLSLIFSACCYRIERVHQVAVTCADRIVREVPSALCQKQSLFALLELLTLMWKSCLEAETDEYERKSSFTSICGNFSVELSDDFELRRRILNSLYRKAKFWVTSVINIAPLDVKGLLQTYLSAYDDDDDGTYGQVSLGRSFAIEMGSLIPSTDSRLDVKDLHGDCNINTVSEFIAQYTTRQGYRNSDRLRPHKEWGRPSSHNSNRPKNDVELEDAVRILTDLKSQITEHRIISLGKIRDLLRRAAALLYQTNKNEVIIVHYLVNIPFSLFTNDSIKFGISLWSGVLNENPQMGPRLLMEIAQHWELTIQQRLGVFDSELAYINPFYNKQEFAPTDRELLSKKVQMTHDRLEPHRRLIQFLGSHFNATRLGSQNIEKIFLRILDVSLDGLKQATTHPLARETRFQLILLCLNILKNSIRVNGQVKALSKDAILSVALTWFYAAPCWSYGGNRLQLKAENTILMEVCLAFQAFEISSNCISASKLKSMQLKESLLYGLIESEQQRISVWLHPLSEPHILHSPSNPSKLFTENPLINIVKTAWSESAELAIQLGARFPSVKLQREIRSLMLHFPETAISSPEAVHILFGDSLPEIITSQLKYLLFWAPVNPISAITYFLPSYSDDPYILQYAVRSLESHPVDVTFFYVPQIVQTLRHDNLGYFERYIVDTARSSQLFAHQIIWNMKANSYKDEESQIPDTVKPTLDKVMMRMIAEFPDVDKDFYEKEFAFFDEVTSISGKLKPYIKRPKPEKKQKIEEELRKIKVEVGVYLPSNPDGIVIGIDRKSGRPLQSHAKAPYMATFRIKKTITNLDDTAQASKVIHDGCTIPQDNKYIELWQSAIFKVGDDCRQDLLALQMIAAFRGIFHHVGLDVYVFPYRVTATAPGCGVIDVLPNSISRDMLGREAVNGLYDYFVSKYGNEDSLRFQEARNNFVKSMAAYSLISFLLQFKDRHNGNIMIDDAGHILHIDFGFCFDIAPGGVKFERAPFKLTSEMIAVMGGNIEHQAFRWFEELCVKAFLAARQYTEELSQIVTVMLDSGLPCFKPETIKNFKERFVLEKTEREAADFMKSLIKSSYKSYSTGVYDQFQLLTNGIPF